MSEEFVGRAEEERDGSESGGGLVMGEARLDVGGRNAGAASGRTVCGEVAHGTSALVGVST